MPPSSSLVGRSGDANALLQRSEHLHTLVRRTNSGSIIAGVVVGVVAFLILVGGGFGWWRMRARKRAGPPKEMVEEREGEAESMDDGDHYDFDVQTAADNGVRGSKLYGPSGHRHTMVFDDNAIPMSPGHTPLRAGYTPN